MEEEQKILSIEEAYNEQMEFEKEMQKDYKTPLDLGRDVDVKTTKIHIDSSKGVRKVNTANGTRMVYELKNDDENCLMASPYLHSLIIKCLNDGIEKITIIKSKSNGKTRYDLEATEI